MKRITKMTAMLLSAILLCSCTSSGIDDPIPTSDSPISAANAEETFVSETETDSLTDSGLTETRDGGTSATASLPQPAPDFYSSLSLDGKKGLVITGEPLNPDELQEYQYRLIDPEEKYWASEFVESLNRPEITDLYIRAQSLVKIFSNEYLYVVEELLNEDHTHKNETVLDASAVGKYAYYVETGVKFDSFAEAWLEVFTKSALDRAFSWYNSFVCYNKELWFSSGAMTGDISVVHCEYELITNSESEVFFKQISYCVKSGEEPLVYDPEKKDEYRTYPLEYKFVMTENGWRADEFPIYSRTLDGEYPGMDLWE